MGRQQAHQPIYQKSAIASLGIAGLNLIGIACGTLFVVDSGHNITFKDLFIFMSIAFVLLVVSGIGTLVAIVSLYAPQKKRRIAWSGFLINIVIFLNSFVVLAASLLT